MVTKYRFLYGKIICLLFLLGVPNAMAQESDFELPKRVRSFRQGQLTDVGTQSGVDAEFPASKNLSLRRQAGDGNTASSLVPRTGPISGYMDFHFNNAEFQDPVLDFHRFVLLFNHSFSDRVRFVSELELEHAVVSKGTDGELELEQAYVDFLVRRSFNVRAGMVLAPVGVINERHEPPVFHGVERPSVETVIIPTTWFGAGAGVHGEVGNGFRYRAYAMETLDASGFSADSGLRDGRQKELNRTQSMSRVPGAWNLWEHLVWYWVRVFGVAIRGLHFLEVTSVSPWRSSTDVITGRSLRFAVSMRMRFSMG